MFIRGSIVLLLACVATCVFGEMFTSMAHMQAAIGAESEIAAEMKRHIEVEEKRLARLKRIAADLEQHSVSAEDNPEFYFGNPVNAFLFIKRFTLDWDRDVDPLLTNSTAIEFGSKIQTLKENYLPTYEDLSGAVAALLRLQDTYRLDTSSIAMGDVGGTRSSELSAEECYEIGRQAYVNSDFYHTIMWMQESLDREKEERNKTVSRVLVLDYLTYASYKQGNVRHALTLTKELLSLDPDHSRASQNLHYFERMIEEDSNSVKRGDDGELRNVRQLDEYRNSEEFATYEALCRGEVVKPYKYRHRLVCRYRSNNHPILLLKPVKEEEVYLNPWLVVYHDILTDYEMNTIKRIATPKLNRATVQNSRTGELETASYRVSKSAWLKDEDDEVIVRVNRRIGAVTGLEMSTAEELQIANYGIGGHYEPHYDFARKEEKSAFKSLGTGNRIATLISYLSTPEAGGATVFPYLGVRVAPQKGMAAFWYNLYKSGEGIYDTRHAACPVLVGTKWVSNKWIHERGQEFRRPCGINADE